jgi:hypothetical protein
MDVSEYGIVVMMMVDVGMFVNYISVMAVVVMNNGVEVVV